MQWRAVLDYPSRTVQSEKTCVSVKGKPHLDIFALNVKKKFIRRNPPEETSGGLSLSAPIYPLNSSCLVIQHRFFSLDWPLPASKAVIAPQNISQPIRPNDNRSVNGMKRESRQFSELVRSKDGEKLQMMLHSYINNSRMFLSISLQRCSFDRLMNNI